MNPQFRFINSLRVTSKIHLSIQFYLFVTELFFFIGPWDWQVPDMFGLILFLLGVHLSIFISYILAKTKAARNATSGLVYFKNVSNIKFLKLAIIMTIALAIPTSMSRTGSPIPDVTAGLADLGAVYNENFERLSEGNNFAFIEYIRILLSPLLIGTIATSVFYWKSIPTQWKLMSVFAVSFSTAIYIAIGTNKGIADLVILAPLFAHLHLSANNDKHSFIFHRINAIGIGAFIIFLIFFGQTQELRQGNVGVGGIHNTGLYLIYADPYALPDWVNSQWVIVYQSITRYLTSGYQALALALQIENAPTYGFGNSMFLTENIDKIFGSRYLSDNNLPAVLETNLGWSRYYLWHTGYVWFMSDFGTFGTIILIGIFGYILFFHLIRTIIDQNIISVIIVQQMFVLFLYLPANNQLFQNGEGLFGTLGILILGWVNNRAENSQKGGLEWQLQKAN